jgi:hypothetical protein
MRASTAACWRRSTWRGCRCACRPAGLPAGLPACLPARPPARRPARLPACPPACLPACLPLQRVLARQGQACRLHGLLWHAAAGLLPMMAGARPLPSLHHAMPRRPPRPCPHRTSSGRSCSTSARSTGAASRPAASAAGWTMTTTPAAPTTRVGGPGCPSGGPAPPASAALAARRPGAAVPRRPARAPLTSSAAHLAGGAISEHQKLLAEAGMIIRDPPAMHLLLTELVRQLRRCTAAFQLPRDNPQVRPRTLAARRCSWPRSGTRPAAPRALARPPEEPLHLGPPPCLTPDRTGGVPAAAAGAGDAQPPDAARAQLLPARGGRRPAAGPAALAVRPPGRVEAARRGRARGWAGRPCTRAVPAARLLPCMPCRAARSGSAVIRGAAAGA